jgi:cobyrinic acid a,c-diamide synthase
MAARGVILAAPASGSGKTVLTLGLLRALSRQFQRIGAFKVGPDYIDPAFHAAATGRASFNIDLWAMRPATVAQILRRLDNDSDLIVGEGVMGLFDGAADNSGSTADVAALTGLPVILVVDVRGQAASVGALPARKTSRPRRATWSPRKRSSAGAIRLRSPASRSSSSR